MSRIGKLPIKIPAGVDVKKEGDTIFVKGPKGELNRKIDGSKVLIVISDGMIEIKPAAGSPEGLKLWGTYGAHIKNMIKGVIEGFSKSLEIEGIGFRAEVQGGKLVLNLGFSHPVSVEPVDGIVFGVTKNVITVSGADKEKVGEMAARIKAFKKPEPYKGKGIRYQGEIIMRKAGKKAATTNG